MDHTDILNAIMETCQNQCFGQLAGFCICDLINLTRSDTGVLPEMKVMLRVDGISVTNTVLDLSVAAC